ncbi:MAG TPA: hypothetical protein DEG47_20540, partial [Cyanobacteria bacterium UBA11148]|nr:hypothetical protein [Cyanobacteria bacterium UBA11148]
ICVIIGAEEAALQKCGLKNMKTGEQVKVELADLVEEVKKQLG